ncbi:DNA repair protein RadA [Candidatus Shapirobacteria bacterium CG_4_9_14_3_um_filter_39_13]|uniref:DNA repair protein RadA n=2 Tax=Microgenomates group TaxID=1794810 RepID=A0A2M7XL81_9BACT|nr:MAG: DNA repair protein RadA [Candidatus Shapirobacteria bacterium CG_4_9_14_3_um_filter_39_13]
MPTTKKGFSIGTSFAASPQKLSQIKPADLRRIKTNISEFDRVLGGGPPAGEAGLVPGSVVLVAGEPGIGKSTLMLELGDEIGGLYISGEESLHQIKLRAERLKIKGEKILFLSETDVDIILETIKNFKKEDFKVLIVDSIQTLTTQDLTSSAGSVGQVRECASKLLRMAKSSNIAVFLIGHVTKEGMLAGPKILEHMVDTVLSLEGEKFGAFRLLRTTKNRFGATDEVGVFEMTDKGMVGIENPSKLFLSQRQKSVPGSVIVATMEGTRPVLVEIQALVTPTQLAIPRRVASGIDYNRLQLITAVLSKRLGLPLGNFDVLVNVAGGLRVEEPAVDLGAALAIYSSFKNLAIEPRVVVFGELGLLGEIRSVSQNNQRIKEAKRLGFVKIISPEKYSSINQAVKNLQ